jgi:hypothetical protein
MGMPDKERLRSIKTFPSLVKYLRDELDWPIESEDFEELTFDYAPEELGLDRQTAVKIKEVKQLRPLVSNQPWGIFFVNFEPKRLPVVVLRRVLRSLVLKKRQSSNKAQQAAWQLHDLLFISSYGESDHRDITFAHFAEEPELGDLPTLRVLGWDDEDTVLHLEHTDLELREKLRWPTDTKDIDAWRGGWSGAFTLRHKEAISTSKALAVRLADLATKIRKRANAVLRIESESGPFRKLYAAFRETLVHDLSEDDFADMYAQTISYGLLTARVSRPAGLVAENLRDMVPVTNPFLKELLETFLTAGGRKGKIDFDELGISEVVQMLRDANMEDVLRDFGDRNPQEDPAIHFYELFLKEYDPKRRIERGVFYTPRPVVSFIVHNANEILKKEFGLEDGLADTATWREMTARHKGLNLPPGISPEDPFVQILDPAVGTGTFLVEVIDVIHGTMLAKWRKERRMELEIPTLWNEYVASHLLPRIYGFELMMAPYAIAHMKIGLKLFETGYRFGTEERVKVFLTDSLEPHQDFSGHLAFDVPALAHEAQAVNEVKSKRAFTVIVGNPPYLREKVKGPTKRLERIGGWVRFGRRGTSMSPLFDDFIKPLAETKQGVHAKLAYELSVIFWRLALWMVFEKDRCPGVVGMISPRAYIAGPGHAGMRKYLRDSVDQVWVLDLGGDNRGARKSENIFEIETGVAIGICTRLPSRKAKTDVEIRYFEMKGSAEAKLANLLVTPPLFDLRWTVCPPRSDTFLPGNVGAYVSWPKLTDLFPWQHSGTQFKRLWPIGESREILEKRWHRLVNMPQAKRPAAFVETDARVVSVGVSGKRTLRATGIVDADSNAKMPRIERYYYRTFDRQWALVDERLADRLRPALVAVLGPQQIFATTLMSKTLGTGPAISVTDLLPDMDVFCNRGAKDVIPLWRDLHATQPNVTPGILKTVSTRLGEPISPHDLLAYCSAILGGPAYTRRFQKELSIPSPRIPVTASISIFRQGVRLGAEFVWFQTFGNRRICDDSSQMKTLQGSAVVEKPIGAREEDYPSEFHYDPQLQTLKLGNGSISGVKSDVYGYSVSGFKVVESWLRYRMKERGGRAKRESTRSVLDEIRPQKWSFTQELLELLWAVEGCVNLWSDLEAFLEKVCVGPQILAVDLPMPSEDDRREPEVPDVNAQQPLL